MVCLRIVPAGPASLYLRANSKMPRQSRAQTSRSLGLVGLVIAVTSLLCSDALGQSMAMAQHDHMTGPAYRDLPAPPLMPGIGNADLKITTSSDAAQAYFNQGLRLLHDFWDFEAYLAFKEAARLDPNVATAYWGEFEALNMHG